MLVVLLKLNNIVLKKKFFTHKTDCLAAIKTYGIEMV